jgi:hypothetical protein
MIFKSSRLKLQLQSIYKLVQIIYVMDSTKIPYFVLICQKAQLP